MMENKIVHAVELAKIINRSRFNDIFIIVLSLFQIDEMFLKVFFLLSARMRTV